MNKSVLAVLPLLLASGAGAAGSAKVKEAMDRLKKDIYASPIAAPALQRYAAEVLLPHSVNPVFVREVRERNNQKVPADKIIAIDKEWMASPSTSPFKTALLASASSKELVRLCASEAKAVREAFVMDNLGAVVGENNLTSDYWQGDEKKWTDSYNAGNGGVSLSPAQFDDSAKAVLQQISLPLWDERGVIIGAITWGVVLDRIQWIEGSPPAKP
jgi:hypothetical protein